MYVEKKQAYEIYYEIKDQIEKEYIKNKEPSGEFINEFEKNME